MGSKVFRGATAPPKEAKSFDSDAPWFIPESNYDILPSRSFLNGDLRWK